MIVVRDVYQARYGKGDELVALFKEAQATWAKSLVQLRVLTDASGPFFTIVTEQEVESFAEWEQLLPKVLANSGFGDWFDRTESIVESGRREFYRIQ